MLAASGTVEWPEMGHGAWEYELWDVFTSRPLGGNPLAVLPDAEGLDGATMQALAREFNLSETAFVLPSKNADARARYFTPARELPMAGHPTVGTAYALAARGRLPAAAATLELGVGVVPLELEREGERLTRVWMDQGRPRRLAEVDSRDEVADALGLATDDLEGSLPIAVASAGVPYLMVPVRGLDALARVHLDLDALAPFLAAEHRAVFAFCLQAGDARVRARMFGEALGVIEDPATGSAHGPLGAYLAWYGIVDARSGPATFLSRQGVEMGRASEILVRVRSEDGEPAVEVGGSAVRVASGRLEL